jgi:AcrR family transcriptional regulator
MTQTRDRKQEIYTTAGSLFSERGYHATSVRDIAKRLNLQGGSLYAHIESKEDVLWQIIQRAAGEFLDTVAPIAADPTPAAERLRRMVRAHVRVVTHHLDDATVFFHEWRFLSPDRRRQVAGQRDAYEAAFRRVVEDGIRAGEFRPVDPKLAALAALSTVNWVYQWYRPDGPLGPDQVADGFTDLILHGMLIDDARGGGATAAPRPGTGGE